MPMQNGIISQVIEKTKEGKKTFYEVSLQDGTKMTTFDSKIMGGSAGDGLDFEALVNGKYVNLKDGWKLTKHASSSTESKPESRGCKSPDERASIEAQTAVKMVIELRCADKLDAVHPLFLKAMDWLDAKIPDLRKPVTTKTQADQEFEKLGRTEDEKYPKTGPELFNIAIKKGWTLDKLKSTLGVNNPTEITDVKAAFKVLFG
jgi:hypothetical protein